MSLRVLQLKPRALQAAELNNATHWNANSCVVGVRFLLGRSENTSWCRRCVEWCEIMQIPL